MANTQLYKVVKVTNHSNGPNRRSRKGSHENSMNIHEVKARKTQSSKENPSESSYLSNISSSKDQTGRWQKKIRGSQHGTRGQNNPNRN